MNTGHCTCPKCQTFLHVEILEGDAAWTEPFRGVPEADRHHRFLWRMAMLPSEYEPLKLTTRQQEVHRPIHGDGVQDLSSAVCWQG
jgi:hypothetical protein